MLGGLAGGFLGAGLFGLLFGHGFFGGMGGFASLIGLVLQIVLIVIVARLLFAWWQRRNAPAPAYANAQPTTDHSFSGLGGMFGANTPTGPKATIEKSDYDDFERLLSDVQAAYSKEDLNALRAKVTPEMLSYFSEQLSENASRGLVNKVTDVRLEQGDLAEAWSEGSAEYATVAMRFSLNDGMVERASGRDVEGDGQARSTELWTFMRARGGGLAAVGNSANLTRPKERGENCPYRAAAAPRSGMRHGLLSLSAKRAMMPSRGCHYEFIKHYLTSAVVRWTVDLPTNPSMPPPATWFSASTCCHAPGFGLRLK